MNSGEVTMPDPVILAMVAKERRLVVEYREKAKDLRAAGFLEHAKEYDKLADEIKCLADELENYYRIN